MSAESPALCLPETFLTDRAHFRVFSRRRSSVTGFIKLRKHFETRDAGRQPPSSWAGVRGGAEAKHSGGRGAFEGDFTALGGI